MKTLLTIITLFFSVALNAQDTTFNKRYYDSDGSDISATMINENKSNGILVSGGGFKSHGVILDIDSAGIVQWNNTVKHVNHRTLITDVCSTSDSSIIVAGYNYYSGADYQDSISSTFFMKLGLEGDTLWTRSFDINKFHNKMQIEYVGATEVDEGQYLLTFSSATDSLLKVVSIDTSGSVLWEKSILGSDFRVHSIFADSDTTFLLSGSIDWQSGFIIKMNSYGDIIWSKQYKDQVIYDVLTLNNRIYCLVKDGQSGYDIFLFKLTSQGEGIWAKPSRVDQRYSSSGDFNMASPPGLTLIDDTLIAMASFDVEIKDTSGSSVSVLRMAPMQWANVAVNDSGRIFISGNGPEYGVKSSTLSRHHIGIIFTNNNLDVTPCSIEGYPPNPSTSIINPDTLITNISNSSSLTNVSYMIDSLSIIVDNECVDYIGSVEEQENIQISVYPNITSGETHFELSKTGTYQVELIDLKGKRIGEFEINGSHGSFDLSNEPAGIYFYKVYNENTNLTGKIIKR